MNDRALQDKTDKQLLNRHIAGDKDAFGVLFKRHHGHMHSVAAGIVGQDADDAVQDATVSAYRKADQFHGNSSVRTWLHRIVVNSSLDIVRRRPLVAEGGDEPLSPTSRITQARQRMDIGKQLDVLSPGQKACLVLVHMMGYSFHEAAKILHVSEGTLKSRCARGRAQLGCKLDGYGRAR
jgi:RNA polymerase sigma-70 factor (ECF subfamily)